MWAYQVKASIQQAHLEHGMSSEEAAQMLGPWASGWKSKGLVFEVEVGAANLSVSELEKYMDPRECMAFLIQGPSPWAMCLQCYDTMFARSFRWLAVKELNLNYHSREIIWFFELR